MAVYITRNSDLGTANSWTTMTACAGETRNDIIVPPGMHSIKAIWLAQGNGAYTTATGNVTAFRIRGLGFEYETVAGGSSGGVLTGAKGGTGVGNPATIINTNILVEPGQSLTLEGCQTTTADAGTPFLAATLAFDTGQGEKRWSFARYSISVDTLVTKTTLNQNAVGTTVNHIQFPGNVRRITNIVAAAGGYVLGSAVGGNMIVKLEGAMSEGDQCINIAGCASLNSNEGNEIICYNAVVLPTDIPISPSGVMWIYAIQTGVDWGSPDVGCAVEVV